jgi:GAF domain-containing protein
MVLSCLLFLRQRRVSLQSDRLRKAYHLGEEVLGASSAEAILNRLCESLPGILRISTAHLYLYNRSAKALESVADNRESSSISISSTPEGAQSGAVACFHYRTVIAIPDIDRSPFPIAGDRQGLAKSLLFVPMQASGDVVGVLQLDHDKKTRRFAPDEQELAQHLGNQTGVALRLLDQRSVQEQLFRTEKLAAVGRLITGVVNELQAPLSSISDLADRAIKNSRAGPAEREVGAIAAEAQKAAAMVARLVSFAPAEQMEARPVSISALLHSLIEFREGDCKASGIRVRNLTSREPFLVLGLQGQLEQVFLNLVVHAEQSLANAPQKILTIRTSLIAKRLLIEISFTSLAKSQTPEETAAVLGLTRGVIGAHGGEVRLIQKSNAEPRFEVELPVVSQARSSAAAAVVNGANLHTGRTMTVLVIEPDENAQRHIRDVLAARGCRVVPVNDSDTGLDLAQRVQFDIVFASVHAPGLNWVELSEQMKSRVAAFVLLPDRYDAELAADFEGDARFVLPKPVQENELDGILQSIDRSVPLRWRSAG